MSKSFPHQAERDPHVHTSKELLPISWERFQLTSAETEMATSAKNVMICSLKEIIVSWIENRKYVNMYVEGFVALNL